MTSFLFKKSKKIYNPFDIMFSYKINEKGMIIKDDKTKVRSNGTIIKEDPVLLDARAQI